MQSKIQAQIQGLGVGFLPLHLIKAQLASGELVAKSCAFPRTALPIYLASEKGKSGKAMTWFIDEFLQQDWFK